MTPLDLKAIEDDKFSVIQNIKLVSHSVENIVGKRENGGYHHFLLFPQCFPKLFVQGLSKPGTVQ